MTAADKPATEPSVRGWVVVDKKTGALDWDGKLHSTHDAAYLGLRAYGDTAEAVRERRTFYDVLPVLDDLPAPQPAADADAEPVQRATELLVQHQATSVSGCICGGVPLGRSHPEHAARVLDDVGLLASTRDSRIDAWHKVAEHPVFASSYHEGVPLIESVLRRLDAIDQKEADRG